MAYSNEYRQTLITDPVLMMAEIERLREENDQLKNQITVLQARAFNHRPLTHHLCVDNRKA